jgi:hypothetical protein
MRSRFLGRFLGRASFDRDSSTAIRKTAFVDELCGNYDYILESR